MARSTEQNVGKISDPLASVRAYHRQTKHRPERYARGPGHLDWANQPDPFRRYIGARLVELPLARTDPKPSYSDLTIPGDVKARSLSRESLSLFLELSLGLSAWKEYQASRWALRVNPSSGNLHPTEGYVVLPPLEGQ